MTECLRDDGVCETRFRVRYADTDAMGIVHHAQYIIWFEEGRSALMRVLGMPYTQVERTGYWFTVSGVEARYLAPARYDEEILVATHIAKLASRCVNFAYEVRRVADGARLVTGSSRHICIDHQGRVCKIPAEFYHRLAYYLQRVE